jgi:Fe-Mn family superoxide dismutase
MFELEPLPYSKDSFEPVLSRESFDYHYEIHHRTYLNNVNKLLEGGSYFSENGSCSKDLVEIAKKAQQLGDVAMFNNAAQCINHSFFWKSINPNKKEMSAEFLALIERSFGSFELFKKQFVEKGVGVFGSGWVWLVLKKKLEKLEIVQTFNAGSCLIDDDERALCVLDVWEHSYYINYRNKRMAYLESIFDYIDWDFAQKNINEKNA